MQKWEVERKFWTETIKWPVLAGISGRNDTFAHIKSLLLKDTKRQIEKLQAVRLCL